MIGINNPFNIRFAKANNWRGQTGQTRGFCNFDTLEHGVRAAAYLLCRSYRRKGIVIVNDIIRRFAPESENDVASYLRYVCRETGFSKNHELLYIGEYVAVLRAMAFFESRTDLSSTFVFDIIKNNKLLN